MNDINNIPELVNKIKVSNLAYRTGDAIITDAEYDILIEKLESIDPDNDLLKGIGFEIKDTDRKEKLPITMASMNKVKRYDVILHWFNTKNINRNSELVLTPKYDGLSLCVHEDSASAWTRGDGKFGQRSDEHLNLIDTNILSGDIYTFGEVIMPRDKFIEKYSKNHPNARNLVSGAINAKELTKDIHINILSDSNYVRYGMKGLDFDSKSKQLDYLNSTQKTKVPYKLIKIDEISEDYLSNLYLEWNKIYEIDGIIIELNNQELRDYLGRETSTLNPAYARAYKGDFEEVKESKVVGVSWNISKQGYLKPIIHIEPTQLDGVTVSNITGNNAKFMKEMGIGTGSIIKVKRSGMVIPTVVEVVKKVDFIMPEVGVDVCWNDNGVELMTLEITDDQKLKQIISFFKILDVTNVGEGVCKQLFENGYNTIKKILSLKIEDLNNLDRFGKRKSQIVYSSIRSKMDNLTLSKLQHATGLFNMLGSKKLLLLENLENPTIDSICKIEGFSNISAKAYLDAIEDFNKFLKDLGNLVVVNKSVKKESISDDLKELIVVFTGVRRNDLKKKIELRGGKVTSGVSSKIKYLIVKEKGSGSNKEKRAIELGKEILTVEELENILN